MAETKRMHFVPKTYLKHFSKELTKGKEKEHFIYVLHKSTVGFNQIKEVNIKNVCVENDIYTLHGSTSEERQFIERMYNTLYESGYDNLYKILTDDTKDTLTTEERYSIISFVVSMFYRNNSWANGYNKLMDETYAKAFHLSKANGKDSFFLGETEISIAGKTLEDLQKENRKQDSPMIAATLAKKIFELTRLRSINDVVTVIKLTGDFEYITSDNPITFRNESLRRPIPIDPTNTLTMPIDSKHLLQLRSWGHELDPHTIGRMNEASFIAGINTMINNQFQSKQSGKFLLGTQSGLEKFLQDPNAGIKMKV
jgi:hypothetical protein